MSGLESLRRVAIEAPSGSEGIATAEAAAGSPRWSRRLFSLRNAGRARPHDDIVGSESYRHRAQRRIGIDHETIGAVVHRSAGIAVGAKKENPARNAGAACRCQSPGATDVAEQMQKLQACGGDAGIRGEDKAVVDALADGRVPALLKIDGRKGEAIGDEVQIVAGECERRSGGQRLRETKPIQGEHPQVIHRRHARTGGDVTARSSFPPRRACHSACSSTRSGRSGWSGRHDAGRVVAVSRP